jgi:DNA-binding response OmpR family regulator
LGTNIKILYIEDEPDLLDAVCLVLEYTGFDVVGVANGRIGLDRARTDKPDLILFGLEMPGIDGWQLHQQLKADDGLKDIPTVVATGHDEYLATQRGLDMSRVDAYLTKPFTPRRLLSTIYGIVGHA